MFRLKGPKPPRKTVTRTRGVAARGVARGAPAPRPRWCCSRRCCRPASTEGSWGASTGRWRPGWKASGGFARSRAAPLANQTPCGAVAWRFCLAQSVGSEGMVEVKGKGNNFGIMFEWFVYVRAAVRWEKDPWPRKRIKMDESVRSLHAWA